MRASCAGFGIKAVGFVAASCLVLLNIETILAGVGPARVIRSAQSGPWSSATTWEGGKTPSAGVKVQIREGHTVVYDVHSDQVIRSLHVHGTLTFATDRDTRLDVGLIRITPGDNTDEEGFDCNHPAKDKGNATKADPAFVIPGFSAPCLCCDGKAALLVGTPEQPIRAKHTALIRLHYIAGMNKESCPAIVCCGGRMDFHGTPLSRTWVRLGSTAKSGDVSITLAEPVTGWKASDRIIVTRTVKVYAKESPTEEAVVQSIEGTTLRVAKPLAHHHSGEDDYRGEVANLSRNVIVESADPNGVRGHTMYHRNSAGSISYAEFRHLGKKDVLGRYSLHYHLCGDTMRGSSVIGASIWDSHNRWFTIHGTNYLVVRDCVGYQSIGHGYFLEDGTEIYNVFDRNLACTVMAGKPLPKQMLPYDKNDGAGFWWANSHNSFTRNVAVDCERYGFRFDAQPKAGTVVDKITYGNPRQAFDLTLNIRQPDGSLKKTDLRTLPFVRFENNETHSNGFWGLNLGQHTGGKIGPDAATPFVVRNMKIWDVTGGFTVEVPHVLIDGMTVSKATYATRESQYVAQDFRNVTLYAQKTPLTTLEQYLAHKSANGTGRARQPGWPKGNGDGGPKVQAPEIEVAKLNPIDKLPPITVITQVRKGGDKLIVRGTTSDDGVVTRVQINGQAAKSLAANYSEWEAQLDRTSTGELLLTAGAVDAAGNAEKTPHAMKIVVR